MTRVVAIAAVLLCVTSGNAFQDRKASYPYFDYEETQKHELPPHRRTIPMEGVGQGFNQLHLTLTVSPQGQVSEAKATGEGNLMALWPELEGEVREWRFTPFLVKGQASTVEVEEYLDLVPPERLPAKHVAAPAVTKDAKIEISLERTGCYGSCPSYRVTLGNGDIFFDGGGFVVATGKHHASVPAEQVRELAQRFVKADFYSMEDQYQASVTDNPTQVLAISIDGRKKQVIDYVGQWVGMPQVIDELEVAVDELADTKRWIDGSDGLVEALTAEKYNFKTFEAQVILKSAAQKSDEETVKGLLEAGVPLKPFAAPKPKEKYELRPFEHVGWLTAGSGSPEVLEVLVGAEASKDDQADKDLALQRAALSGKVQSVRTLLAYGANPNADLSKLMVVSGTGFMSSEGAGAGSILIAAAESGNPEMVKEILLHHPKLEARDSEGKTAIFSAGDSRGSDEDGGRVECVRLLAKAGANVNARDHDGNTPLHETFLTDVEEELLKLGADVNARNKDGETPIFTTVDNDAIPLLLVHGADLSIRNKKGQTVVEAAADKGPLRQEALQNAIESLRK